MKSLLQRFATETSGATALEYALLAMLVCLVPMVAFGAAGEAIAGLIGQATAGLAGPGGHMNVLP